MNAISTGTSKDTGPSGRLRDGPYVIFLTTRSTLEEHRFLLSKAFLAPTPFGKMESLRPERLVNLETYAELALSNTAESRASLSALPPRLQAAGDWLETTLPAHRAALEHLCSEVSSAAVVARSAEKSLESAQRKYRGSKTKLRTARMALAGINGKLSALNALPSSNMSELSKLQTSLNELQETLSAQKTQKDELKQTLSKKTAALARTKSCKNHLTATLTHACNNLRKQIKGLEAAITETKKQIEEATARRDLLTTLNVVLFTNGTNAPEKKLLAGQADAEKFVLTREGKLEKHGADLSAAEQRAESAHEPLRRAVAALRAEVQAAMQAVGESVLAEISKAVSTCQAELELIRHIRPRFEPLKQFPNAKITVIKSADFDPETQAAQPMPSEIKAAVEALKAAISADLDAARPSFDSAFAALKELQKAGALREAETKLLAALNALAASSKAPEEQAIFAIAGLYKQYAAEAKAQLDAATSFSKHAPKLFGSVETAFLNMLERARNIEVMLEKFESQPGAPPVIPSAGPLSTSL